MTFSLPLILIAGLAAARAWRFAAIDDMPWLVSARAWLVGESILTPTEPVVKHYRRPTLHHLIECPWCLGSYLAVGAFALARLSPGVAVWVLGPLAIGELVGLIVRNLDPTEE